MDKDTPTNVIIEKENEYYIKDRTSPKTINLELLNQWRIKDHTKPKDVTINLSGGGTFDHRELDFRDAEDQHPISAITGLQDLINNIINQLEEKVSEDDLARVAFTGDMNDLISNQTILYCGTSTEVI